MIKAGIDHITTGDGPSVIFLHGIGGQASNFAAITAELASGLEKPSGEGGFTCHAINLPGYGVNPPAPEGLNFKNLSKRLANFIDQLDEGPVHLVGHSIGGMIALDHAIRRPDQTRSLGLLASTAAFGGKDDTFKDAFLKARLGPLEAGQSMAEMAAASAPHLVASDTDPQVLAEVEASLAAVPLSVWREVLTCLVTFNRRDDLGLVNCPVQVIAGSEDSNAPPQTLERMAARFDDGRFTCLNDAGHILPIEAPRQIVQTLRTFWKVC